jgi:hypothetical protein
MICQNCGKNTRPAKFCVFCGTLLDYSQQSVAFAYVCQKNFDELDPIAENERERFCSSCNLKVTNLDALTEIERDRLIKDAQSSRERVCVSSTIPPRGCEDCSKASGSVKKDIQLMGIVWTKDGPANNPWSSVELTDTHTVTNNTPGTRGLFSFLRRNKTR